MDRSKRSLEEYKISDELVNDFLTTLDILKDNNYRTDAKTWTINGFQTDNILNLKTTHELAKNLLKEIKKDLDLFWIHLIEYNQAGAQTAHDHSKTEDYSFILYLNDCDKNAKTVIVDDKDKIIKTITPQKYKGICFDSLPHYQIFPKHGLRLILVATFI